VTQEATWSQQLDIPLESEIRPVREGRKRLRAGLLMLYPNGRAVDTALRAIPAGQTRTVSELREEMARAHGADTVCPVTTGIALRTVAEAVYEDLSAGRPIAELAPVWRVLDAKAPTLKKVSFDPAFILEQRAREAGPAAR
jgi:hypothetical protein